jgi:shikimate dehydrogenase
MGIAGAYVHFAVRPDEAVYAFKSLKRTSIVGVNVTLPLKNLAFKAADAATADAQKLGVANCLYKRSGNLIAHNTDLEGFAAPLIKAMGPSLIARTPAVVYGTGGAARAVIGALLALGSAEIRLCGRTDIRAESMVKDIGVPSLYAVPWAMRNDAMSGAGLIVNASAAGMKGRSGLDVDLSAASAGTTIYDLVYTPLKTPLLIEAERFGLQTLGGLSMLIEQARPSFRLFFGKAPPEDLDPSPILIKALGE